MFLATPSLSARQNYYVIVGSAGAALIGVQFVVMTLIATMRKAASAETVAAFGTPTVLQFAAALVIAATMTAPWPSLVAMSVAIAACGVGGLVYSVLAIRRARRQKDYEPVWQDWLWYGCFPCLLYGALATVPVLLGTATEMALLLIAGIALGLLLVAIHNAWDSVTHIVTVGS